MAAKQLMPYKKEDEAIVWRIFEKTPQAAEEDVETIKNWIRTQPHIPEITAEAVIKNFLRIHKCSVERTKQALDKYYSIRNFASELFTHHPLSAEMLESYKVWYWVCLPKRVGLQRVTIFKLADDNPEKLNIEHVFSHAMNFAEIRMLNDCFFKDIFIFDLTGAKTRHLLKIPITLVHKLIVISDQVYSSRVSAVHIINGFEAILSAIMSVMKPKVRERVHIHKSYDSLHKLIPKEVLPEDLRGEEKSLKELAEIQLKCFEEMKDRYDVLVKMKSNEALRPENPVNDETFGFYGNFRKIEVD